MKADELPLVSVARIRGWSNRLKVEAGLVALFCLVAFIGAGWVSESVFERLPHTEDEAAFLFQAQTIASGQIFADAPENPEFFSIPFIIVRDGMWFGKYPPGYPAVLALGVVAGAPWLVNATFAALSVLLIFLFARYLYGGFTGLLAAGLLTASPLFLLQAGSLLSHIVSLFWTLFFLALYPLARSQRGLLLPALTGFAIGMLFLTRPFTAVGIAIPYILWTLATIARQHRIQRSYLVMAAAALPFVVAYLAYNNATTGSPFQTAYELWWDFDRLGFGPDIGINGHDLDDGLRNTRTNASSLARFLFGWPGRLSLAPAVAAVAVSLLILFRRMRKNPQGDPDKARLDQPSPEAWDLILASVALSLVAIHILYWTPGQMYGPRYFMEAVGPLVILSARVFTRLGAALGDAAVSFRPRAPHTTLLGYSVPILMIAALTAYAYLSWAPNEFDRFRDWNHITGDDVAVVEAAHLDNALVFVERQTWTDYAPFFAHNRPTLDTSVVYASDRGDGENRLLMDLYPDREYFRYANGQISRLTP